MMINRVKRKARLFCLRKSLSVISAVLLLSILAGCSAKGSYQAFQQSNAIECEQLPDSQKQECFKRLEKTYEEYQRERKTLQKPDNSA